MDMGTIITLLLVVFIIIFPFALFYYGRRYLRERKIELPKDPYKQAQIASLIIVICIGAIYFMPAIALAFAIVIPICAIFIFGKGMELGHERQPLKALLLVLIGLLSLGLTVRIFGA